MSTETQAPPRAPDNPTIILSHTRLEFFKACPYKYFVNCILGKDPRIPPVWQPVGSMCHAALLTFAKTKDMDKAKQSMVTILNQARTAVPNPAYVDKLDYGACNAEAITYAFMQYLSAGNDNCQVFNELRTAMENPDAQFEHYMEVTGKTSPRIPDLPEVQYLISGIADIISPTAVHDFKFVSAFRADYETSYMRSHQMHTYSELRYETNPPAIPNMGNYLLVHKWRKKRKKGQTRDDFIMEMAAAYFQRPADYFKHIQVPLVGKGIIRHMEDMARLIHYLHHTFSYWQDRSVCDLYGGCGYAEACWGFDNIETYPVAERRY